MEAKGRQAGAYYVPDRHLLYSAQTLTQQLYPKVITAIRDLAAERVGHGTSSAEDPALLAHLAEHRIPIEVCPTSNVLTGAAPSIREHPLHAFLAAGCRVVLGDDNPINIGARISDEEERLLTEGGLTQDQLVGIHRTACDVAFTDASTRTVLRRRFSAS